MYGYFSKFLGSFSVKGLGCFGGTTFANFFFKLLIEVLVPIIFFPLNIIESKLRAFKYFSSPNFSGMHTPGSLLASQI